MDTTSQQSTLIKIRARWTCEFSDNLKWLGAIETKDLNSLLGKATNLTSTNHTRREAEEFQIAGNLIILFIYCLSIGNRSPPLSLLVCDHERRKWRYTVVVPLFRFQNQLTSSSLGFLSPISVFKFLQTFYLPNHNIIISLNWVVKEDVVSCHVTIKLN